MTLEDLIAGLFGGQGPQQAGPTPNDLIMKQLGGLFSEPEPQLGVGMPAADSQRVARSVLPPVGGQGQPGANAAPAPTSSQQNPLGLSTEASFGLGDYLKAFSEGAGDSQSITGAIGNLLTAPGKATEARRKEVETANLTYQVLRKKGLDETEAKAAIANPALMKEILPALYGKGEHDIREIWGDDGRKRMALVSKADGSFKPIGGSEATADKSLVGPYKDAKQKADVEEGLRREISSSTKDWSTIRDAHAKIKAVGGEAPSPAGDMALVFGIMKLYDPGSVVRETEYATAENAASVPDRVRGLWNKILEGVRLTPEQRADFLGQSDVLAQSQAQRTKRVLEQYRGVSERLGVDTRNVILDDPEEVGRIGEKPPAPKKPDATNGAPQPGSVMDGYRFKGGDPADPKSWERVQ